MRHFFKPMIGIIFVLACKETGRGEAKISISLANDKGGIDQVLVDKTSAGSEASFRADCTNSINDACTNQVSGAKLAVYCVWFERKDKGVEGSMEKTKTVDVSPSVNTGGMGNYICPQK